jgi:hypothetical protein
MPGFELAEEISAFTLACPTGGGDAVSAIRARGNLPLVIDGRVLAELDADDVNDNWAQAGRLSAIEAIGMSEVAGRRLSQVLEDNINSSDLPDMVADAAVLFLLTLRRHGIASPQAAQPCTVVWEGMAGHEHLLMRASAADDDSF